MALILEQKDQKHLKKYATGIVNGSLEEHGLGRIVNGSLEEHGLGRIRISFPNSTFIDEWNKYLEDKKKEFNDFLLGIISSETISTNEDVIQPEIITEEEPSLEH
ncbi:unnamed protein product [Meganyctiphanes norvegica]|uniref:DUF2286 domain-containing protein n=1 Tax=Meganyctiphanes norvegica TaxID=48144 RepID=A0AAV2SB96_MEGNR